MSLPWTKTNQNKDGDVLIIWCSTTCWLDVRCQKSLDSRALERLVTDLIDSHQTNYRFFSADAGSHAMIGLPGLVIGVLSSRDNFMQRQAVRHTWAAKLRTSQHQKQLPSQLVFVLGDQDCYVHPRLRASNPNHCPQLPDDPGTTAAGRCLKFDCLCAVLWYHFC